MGAGGAALGIGVWLALESGMPADMVVAAATVLALVLARLTLTIVMNDRLLQESERRASTDPAGLDAFAAELQSAGVQVVWVEAECGLQRR